MLHTVLASLALLTPPLAQVQPQAQVRLDRFTEDTTDAWLRDTVRTAMPSGWALRAVSGERLPSVAMTDLRAHPTLVMIADSAAGQAWLELDDHLDAEAGRLSWEWSVAERTHGSSLRAPELDDAPARFFVAFGGGGLFGRPRLLFYTWGDMERKDEAFRSHVSDRVGVIVVRTHADETGVWLTERRDLAADFRRVFDRDPDEVRAVGLMSDTDQLGGRAEVRLRAIRWQPSGEGRSRPTPTRTQLGAERDP